MKISLEQFSDLIASQLKYGGVKYRLLTTRESTDELFDTYSPNWLYGTCHKYVLRFVNTQREKDLLKIATYCYLLWLKRGFHISTVGLAKAVDTNVKLKEEFFPDFLFSVFDYYEKNEAYLEKNLPIDSITKIGNMFKCFSYNGWQEVSEEKLIHIYCLAYCCWKSYFFDKGLAGGDQDTNNEENELKKKLLQGAIGFFQSTEVDEENLVLLVENQIKTINKKDTNV